MNLDLEQITSIAGNAGVYRADVDQIQRIRKPEEARFTTKFSNTHIVGDVSITDDSNYMMTSIPYSDGWKVKVDGKFVKTEKAWNAFLSFPISRNHKVIRLLDKRRDPGCLAIVSVASSFKWDEAEVMKGNKEQEVSKLQRQHKKKLGREIGNSLEFVSSSPPLIN